MKKCPLIYLITTFLLFLTVTTSVAQSDSTQTFYLNLQEELDLFTPDSLLGDKIWGLTTLSVSNIRSKPQHSSELVSQITMGTPVKLIEETEGWIRIETPDGYNGWMDNNGLKRFSAEDMNLWKSLNRIIFKSISGYLIDAPNRKGKIISDLVLGDIFVVNNVKFGFYEISTPDGRKGFVRKKDCISWDDWTNRKPDANAILSITRQMVGSPYLWGGTSVKAVDCSGLIKLAYFSQGIILERNASQQAQFGDSVDFRNINNLQPGDLLFFGSSPQAIVHVGIYLGKGEYIHSSGMVQINSIDPLTQSYNLTTRKNLVAARRILSSLNTEGIVQVKYHPWYSTYIP